MSTAPLDLHGKLHRREQNEAEQQRAAELCLADYRTDCPEMLFEALGQAPTHEAAEFKRLLDAGDIGLIRAFVAAAIDSYGRELVGYYKERGRL